MIVAEVEYADGRILLLGTKGEVREYSFTPSILLPPPIFSILDLDLPFLIHPHAVEVFAPLEDLFRLYRKASRITDSVLLLPPTRQFLLKRGITYGHKLEGYVPVGLPPVQTPEEAMRSILRERYYTNPAVVFLENAAYLARVPVSLGRAARRRTSLEWSLRDVFSTLSHLRVAPDADYGRGDTPLPASKGTYAGSGLLYGEALLFGLEADWTPTELHYRPPRESPFLQQILWILLAAARYYSILPKSMEHSTSIVAQSAHNYLMALHELAEGVSQLLLTTRVLGDVGRRSLLLGLRLRHRRPKLYSSLYANVPICSRGLKGLEYFLHVRFSSPTARRP